MNVFFRKYFLILFLFSISTIVFSTNRYTDDEFVRTKNNFVRFKNFSTKDGLSSGPVLNILRDKYNIMWFATTDGLTRYDGQTFSIYKNKKESENSLSDNLVICLTEDIDGNLWIGTRNGLNRYNRDNNTFTRYFTEKNNKNALRSNYIMALYADKEGNLWILSKGGHLNRFNVRHNTWEYTYLYFPNYEGDYYYNHIIEDKNHHLWLGGRNRAPVKISNKNFSKTTNIQGDGIFLGETTFFTETKNGDLFCGNVDNHLNRYDTLTNTFKPVLKLNISGISGICDNHGNLWIGGSPGIEQINLKQKEIKIIKNNPFDSESLISNRVYCIYKDKNDCIWIGTEKGVSLYSEGLNLVKHYKLIYGLEDGLTSNNITALIQDKDGLMWVGNFENGVDTFSLEKEKFGNLKYNLLTHNLDKPTFNREKEVLKQYFKHKFISTENKNINENYIFNNYRNFKQIPLKFNERNENRVSALYQDKDGKIYVGLWSYVGFNVYDKTKNIIKRYALWGKGEDSTYPHVFEGNPFGANFYAGFLEDRQSNFWCITWEAFGLNLFDREKGEFLPKHYIPGNKPKADIHTLAFDPKNQRMYVGGSYYYGYYDFKTKSYVRYCGILPENYVNRKIFENYSQYCNVKWVNIPCDFTCYPLIYQDSVNLIQCDGYIIKHTLKNDKFEVLPEKRIPFGINNKKYAGRNHTLWDYSSEGLIFTDSVTGKTMHFQYDAKNKNGIIGNIIKSVCEDGNGNLWISTENGLCILNRKTMQFEDLSMPDDKMLNSRLMSCIMQDKSGQIWMGTTENGISVLNLETDHLHHYIYHEWDENGISDNNINCIFESSNGSIWVGTIKGLDKYNPAQNNFVHNDALSGYKIMNIQEDNSGRLWVSTNNGLFCLDASGKIIRDITNFPGLQGPVFSKAGCKLNNGLLAFGGDYGFNVFNPESLMKNFESKPIVFSGFMVEDSLRHFDLSNIRKINLKYNENSFSVSFCSTDYEYGELLKYRYKLNGFDNDWIYAKYPTLTAKYTNIPSGEYIFTVEVSNCFGEWKGFKNELAITISTPWYKQAWFIILIILFISMTVYLIIRIREKRLMQDNIRLENMVEKRTSELKEANRKLMESEEELRAMNDSKNRFFGIISHDLRNPLKALSLTTQSLYEQYDALDEKEKYNIIRVVHETTTQTGQLLENLLLWVISQMNMLKPTLKKINLSSSLNDNIELLRLSAEKKNITLINNISKEYNVSADENLLSTIFRNLISNAIHYSYPNSEVIIIAVENNEETEISVIDKGVGISEENLEKLFRLDSKIKTKGTQNEQGTGLGLIITQEFIHLQGGKIEVKSIVNEGSVFTFTLKKYHGIKQ